MRLARIEYVWTELLGIGVLFKDLSGTDEKEAILVHSRGGV